MSQRSRLVPPRPELLALPGGRTLEVRGMAPGDAPGILALYESLDDDDRYRRFFSGFHPTLVFVDHWVDQCRGKGVGLVAVEHDASSSQLVAEAGYVLVGNGDGEFAVTVAPHRRGWLGPYLLERLAEEAAERGVPNLEADILTTNRPMLMVVRQRGMVATGDSDMQSVHVRTGTTGATATWPPSARRPRLVVESRSLWWRAARELTKAGLDVVSCPAGGDGRPACPLDEGRPCPLVAEAEAVVVALPADTDRTRHLLDGHARLHPHVDVLVDAGAQRFAAAAAYPSTASDVAEEVCRLLPTVVVVQRGDPEAQPARRSST